VFSGEKLRKNIVFVLLGLKKGTQKFKHDTTPGQALYLDWSMNCATEN
jgi:hypothetical protein